MAADPNASLPGLCGEPLGWAGWALLASAQAAAPFGWRIGWSVAALSLLPAALLFAPSGASAVPLIIAGMLLAGSLVRIGALGSQIAGKRPRWKGACIAVVLVGGLVLCDWGAQLAAGLSGDILDGVAPGTALGRAANGTLDLGVLLTLSLPGLWAAAWSQFLSRDASTPRTNEATTVVLVPLAGLLALAISPLPFPLLDGTAGGTSGLHRATVATLHRVNRPLMVTTIRGGPLDQMNRAKQRQVERLLSRVTSTALHPVSTQRLGPVESRVLLQAHEMNAPGEAFYGIYVRALDRVHSLLPLPHPDRIQEALADTFWKLGGPVEPPAVFVLGSTGAALGITRPVKDNHLATTAAPDGKAAMVVSPTGEELVDQTLRAIDAHVMRGGGLVLLYGDAGLEDAPFGVSVTKAWGFSAEGSLDSGVADVGGGEWSELGFGNLVVPAGAPAVIGPDGLGDLVASIDSSAVAIAMLGSVPSSFEGPDGEQVGSQGAVRAFFTSALVAEANPGLTARALDWVLDEAELSVLRGSPPEQTRHPLWALLLLTMAPSLAIGAVSMRGRMTMSEPK